jgi:hypothetical protein
MSDMTTRDPTSGVAIPRDRERTTPADERSAFNFRPPREDESLAELVRRLAEQGSHLAEQQMKLVEAEVRSGIDDLKQSAGAMAGAAVLGLAGIGVVLMGVAFLLGQAMPLWLATLIVGVAALAGAYALYAAGQNKLQSSSPNVERTKRTLERAPSAISGTTNEGRSHDR